MWKAIINCLLDLGMGMHDDLLMTPKQLQKNGKNLRQPRTVVHEHHHGKHLRSLDNA
jgi:hypothetical protein